MKPIFRQYTGCVEKKLRKRGHCIGKKGGRILNTLRFQQPWYGGWFSNLIIFVTVCFSPMTSSGFCFFWIKPKKLAAFEKTRFQITRSQQQPLKVFNCLTDKTTKEFGISTVRRFKNRTYLPVAVADSGFDHCCGKSFSLQLSGFANF